MEPKMESVSIKRLTIENSFPTENIYPGTIRKPDGRFCMELEEIEDGYTFFDRDAETQYVRKNDGWVRISEA